MRAPAGAEQPGPSGGVGHDVPPGVQPDQGLAGGDRVAVLDQPLDHGAAVRRDHLVAVAQPRPTVATVAPVPTGAPVSSSARRTVPLAGATTSRQVGDRRPSG